MAYRLKYYAEIVRDGKACRLEILQRDWTGDAMILGSLNSWSVGYVGAQPIEAAIIKSEMRFSLVDAWKTPNRFDPERGAAVKFSRFEEFYTSDALLYKVRFLEDRKARWSGYLTPDSFEEDLVYGGTVSFVARDMLGHLADFDYDYSDPSGMVEISTLIMAGLQKCSAAMGFDATGLIYLMGKATESSNPYPASMWKVNVDGLEGTWYDVIEGILDSIGCTLRWNDNDIFTVTPLRLLVETERARKGLLFANVSGHRALDPAVRKIVEDLRYDSDGSIWEQKASASDYVESTAIIHNDIEEPCYAPSATSPWVRTGDVAIINQFDCTGSDAETGEIFSGLDNVLFFRGENRGSLSRSVRLSATGTPVTLAFTLHNTLYKYDSANKSISALPSSVTPIKEITLFFGIVVTNDKGQTLQYNAAAGNWNTKSTTFLNRAVTDGTSLSYGLSFVMPEGYYDLKFCLYGAQATNKSDSIIYTLSTYVALSDLRLEQTDAQGYKNFKTNTIYSEKNNVIYNRAPILGQVPPVAAPHVIKNGIYSPEANVGYPALQLFKFHDEVNWTRLSILVHKQILLFYDRPNNSVSGEIIDATAGSPHFSDCWDWNGAQHLLTGGYLDVLTGRIGSAVLRQFATWSEIWGTITVTPKDGSVPAGGGSVTFTVRVEAGQTWEVLGLPSWITASVPGATGSGSVTLTVSPNPAYSGRSSIFTIAGVSVSIAQAGRSAGTPTWDAEDKEIDYSAQDVAAITVSANGNDTEVTSSASWLSVDPIGAGGYLAVAEENTTQYNRSATITLSWTGGSKSVTITQQGRGSESPTWNAYDAVIDDKSQVVERIGVSAGSTPVTITSSASWCRVTQDGAEYVVSASANTTIYVRTATITMRWAGGSKSITVTQAFASSSVPTWNARDLSVDQYAQTVCAIIVNRNDYDVDVDTEASWIYISVVNGLYSVRVSSNPSTKPRTGVITMSWPGGTQSVTITQLGAPSDVPDWEAYDTTISHREQDAEVFIVRGNGADFSVASSAGWLEIEREDSVFTAHAAENTSASERSATITLSWSGGSQSVTVTQLASASNIPQWSAQDLVVDSSAQVATYFAARGNGTAITVTSSKSWATITKTDLYGVRVSENFGTAARTATITMSWDGGSKSITITQLGKSVLSPDWDANDVSITHREQDALVFAVIPNGETLEVTSSASWLTLSEGNNIYTAHASENTGATVRSATITMGWSGGSKSVNVIQAGKVSESPNWGAVDTAISSREQDALIFATEDNGKQVTVRSSAAWLTLSYSAPFYTAHASENTDTENRTAFIIMSWEGGSRSVTIVQAGRVAGTPEWNARDRYISHGAQTVDNIAIRENGTPVSVSTNVGWLTLTREGNLVSVYASENTGAAQRSGVITMSWSGGSQSVTISQGPQDTETYHTLTIRSVSPASAYVTVNGSQASIGTPIVVKEGTPITITASASGYRDYSRVLSVFEDMDVDIEMARDSVRYEVSLNLFNCTAPAYDPYVPEGSPFVTTIRPNPGYSIGEAVVVQMGSQTLLDVITRNADGTLSIFIPAATGNIGIMVIAG